MEMNLYKEMEEYQKIMKDLPNKIKDYTLQIVYNYKTKKYKISYEKEEGGMIKILHSVEYENMYTIAKIMEEVLKENNNKE